MTIIKQLSKSETVADSRKYLAENFIGCRCGVQGGTALN
jgi:hypothetical protein